MQIFFCIASAYPIFRKPRNARSKRALEAREPKEVEDPRTAIFVKGTHTGEVLNGAMKELVRVEIWTLITMTEKLHTDGAEKARCHFFLQEKHCPTI